MPAKGVKVITLEHRRHGAMVAKTAERRVSVVAYDRPAARKVEAFVSFDNRCTGELQGKALLDALGTRKPRTPRSW